MSSGPSVGGSAQNAGLEAVELVLPVVRRVVGARVSDPYLAQDLVQETLLRIMTAWDRVEPEMIEAYAITTARNVVATMWRDRERESRNRHRALDLSTPELPEEQVVLEEEQAAIWDALGRLEEQERTRLLAHEVAGQDTRSMAAETGSSAGAVAAQLHRTRARLRVEYLLTLEPGPPPTEDCRPVLLALSSGNRRRQRDLGVGAHLLGCGFCARVGKPLLARVEARDDEVVVPMHADADIVKARQAAREVAAKLGFGKTQTTLIATAVSEVARNIVRFAGRGEVLIETLSDPKAGVRVVARDAGPGIADPKEALAEGFSTYNGLGLGLPGARRLMDEFALTSQLGVGTTVTMTKWLEEG